MRIGVCRLADTATKLWVACSDWAASPNIVQHRPGRALKMTASSVFPGAEACGIRIDPELRAVAQSASRPVGTRRSQRRAWQSGRSRQGLGLLARHL